MVATWVISSLPPTFLLAFLSSLMIASAALSMPRFTSIGLAPAVMFLKPSLKML